MFRLITCFYWLASLCAWSVAQAQDAVRIGIINDQSGPFSATGGVGSVVMAKLAAEDFNGTILGKKIQILSADHQNKTDVASVTAKRWIDVDGVTAIVDGASSAAALAINHIVRDTHAMFLSSGAAVTALTGAACSLNTIQFNYDTYMLANAPAKALARLGDNTWFLIIADYVAGEQMAKDLGSFVVAHGGKVVGSVKHPLNTSDFASYVLQAQASKAKVIGLANTASDAINTIKQAREFGLTTAGQTIVPFLLLISDVNSLDLEVAQGLDLATTFYWDINDRTRALSQRFAKEMNGKMPTMVQAGVYAAVTHYLKSVAAAGATNAAIVGKKMRELKVNDAYNDNVTVREDGRVLHRVYLAKVKTPAESKYPWDYYKVLSSLDGADAYRPLSESDCPLVKRP